MGDIPGNHKGQGPESAHQHPGQGHHGKAVPGVEGGLLGLFAEGEARDQKKQDGPQEGQGRFPIEQRHQGGQKQQRRLRP